MVSYWSLNDSNSPQQDSFQYSGRSQPFWSLDKLLISKSSSPSTSPLVTVPRPSIIIGITLTFRFHSLFFFFNSLARSSSLFSFLQFYFMVIRDCTVHSSVSSLFLIDYNLVWSGDCQFGCVRAETNAIYHPHEHTLGGWYKTSRHTH